MSKTHVVAVLATVLAAALGLTALYKAHLDSADALLRARVQEAEYTQREKQWSRTVEEYKRSAENMTATKSTSSEEEEAAWSLKFANLQASFDQQVSALRETHATETTAAAAAAAQAEEARVKAEKEAAAAAAAHARVLGWDARVKAEEEEAAAGKQAEADVAAVTARHMAARKEQNPTVFSNSRTEFTPQPPLTIDMLQRSRANVGDRKMWEHALCVAQRGGTVQVLAIGGSLTAGSELKGGKASAWPALLQKHFLQWYGTGKVKVINEARASSGSDYWVQHLPAIWANINASTNADATIIMVENGLNDATSNVGVGKRYGSVDEVSMWWERLLRMILAFHDNKGNSVGLVVVEGFVPKDKGYGFGAGQNHHEFASRYYEVPVISQRDAIWHPRFRQEIPVDKTTFDAKSSLRCMFPGQCVSMGSIGHGWDAFCDLCGRKMWGAHPNEDGQRAYSDLIAYNWHTEERGIQCSVGGALDSATGFHRPVATGPNGPSPCIHDGCDTFSDLPLTHLSSFQQSAEMTSAFAKAAMKVRSDEKLEGYWRFAEDKAGKGFGWIATGESRGRIIFPIEMKQGILRVGYLFAYDNMARASLFLATQRHKKVGKKKVLHRISPSKMIDSLVDGKFSGYKGVSFDFSKEVQRALSSTTEDTEPFQFVVVIVHKPPRLAPNSNTSCPQRGQNKFKLLDIQSF